ncbi:hypothetical protein HAX54_040541 [Datura stramonium]|uniref:Uncharacterized protein n=1 Tax=Datura stramonium TaxID=4076 RepID=A0ABS8SK56_DATST|nr:hypothetical protein [Datura stramonium]
MPLTIFCVLVVCGLWEISRIQVEHCLAGVLGTISLIAIQIWSTLWWLMGFFLIHLIKVVAVFGSLFGLTAAAALIIDTISLATTHVSALQLLLTVLYSWQIQAVDALWRLFRGRK